MSTIIKKIFIITIIWCIIKLGDNDMGVKNKLKEIRMKEHMMESKEFSKLLGVPPTVYSGWETGSSRPKLEKALEVAKILNKKVDDIWYLD